MKIIVSGSCGFVGSTLINALLDDDPSLQITGFDNFIRPGSYLNREPLQRRGVSFFYADLRNPADLAALPPADWVIDAAANPSVLAGTDGKSSSRQLLEHNLIGTINLLEFAKERAAGFILCSTSRVYSVRALAALPVEPKDGAYVLATGAALPAGATARGISEQFSTAAPVSLYGASKIASEAIALEYGETFDFPVWINRCGVLAGAGQFGKADQGIFSFWINSYLAGAPLSYIGFDGTGFQTRDCLHPRDLVPLITAQMRTARTSQPAIINIGGGADHAMSLAQLTQWCEERFEPRQVAINPHPRAFDVPWLVMDSTLATTHWNWKPRTTLQSILDEIANHAKTHPNWLEISGA